MTTKPTNPKDVVGIRKAPMSTVSAVVLAEVGVAMLEGACKYGRHNYRVSGVRASVYYDAFMRHMMAWWEGEDVDADSDINHITKTLADLFVLRDAMIQGKFNDDRPPKSAPFYAELNTKAGAIIDKYADLKPLHCLHFAQPPFSDSHETLTFGPLTAADGWIEWNGGECPLVWSTKVEVRFRNMPPHSANAKAKANEYCWNHQGAISDIVAYRLAA